MSLIRGSSYSTRIPSLKFEVLSVPKIRLIFGHGVNQPDNRGAVRVDLSTYKFSVSYAFRSRLMVRHGKDRRTDRQRSSMHYAPPYGDGGVIITHTDQLMCYFKL